VILIIKSINQAHILYNCLNDKWEAQPVKIEKGKLKQNPRHCLQSNPTHEFVKT